MEIREVDYGIANNFGDYIEINKELKKFPKLYDAVLKHELKHTKKRFSLKDLSIDVVNNIDTKELIKFMIKRPKTWIQCLPFYWKNRKLVYDLNLMIVYFIFIVAEISIIKFMFF